ncbi:MalM family protein [Rhodanobacter soli]|uniref:MalM family protein n=1 Tax=Rhodanobacter soli TaxID=590609 RepID=UPI0031D59987
MSLRLPAIAAMLALAALLGGCHTAKALLPPNLRPPSENTGDALKLAQLQLMQASPCCSSFADFSYRNMLPWQPQKFVLGSGSMVANLNGTQSYFLAFRLPTDVKLPYKIALKSELNGRWLHASYLFAPTVVLLDEGFQPIRSEDIGLCEHMGWSDETSGAFGSLKIDNTQARYLLVYSSAEQQSGKTYWEQSPASISSSTTASLQMNSAGSFSIPHGPDGALWVGMMNKTYEKALNNAICKKAAKGGGVLNTLRTALPLPWSNGNNGKANPSGPP